MILPAYNSEKVLRGNTTLAILTVCDQMMNCLTGLWGLRLRVSGSAHVSAHTHSIHSISEYVHEKSNRNKQQSNKRLKRKKLKRNKYF